MWPFKAKISNSELHQAFRDLKADFTALEFEWQQVRHALKKLTGRLAKSEALENTRRADDAQQGAPISPAENGALSLLTDHQKQVQQQILRQRARA